MRKRGSKRNQHFYKMKGCFKKTRKHKLGGSADVNLAYTGKTTPSVPNPFLAYTGSSHTGKGGGHVNTNASKPYYPNTGPIPNGNTVFNSSSPQSGGTCGASCAVNPATFPTITGGEMMPDIIDGGKKHRTECKCSNCKSKINSMNLKGGNAGIPYPNGLVGSPWTPAIGGWSGVDGVPGNNNYYTNNNYHNDISRQMVDVGANRPFLNLKGGYKKTKKQRGGALSNFIGQDIINLGRQFNFGIGSAYNALAGNSAPVNPMPWKDQLSSNRSFNPSYTSTQ
jgi:hypothetical protein